MKQVEAGDLLRVLWRRLWVIVLIMVAIIGLLIFRSRDADPIYEADVTLMVTTPDREDVAVSDDYTFTSDRDLIATAVNSFVEIASYDVVKQRTKTQLGITIDYDVSIDAEIGADLIYITVATNEAELAQKIANAHAQHAIEYFGELRALPSAKGLVYFGEELESATQQLADAENAMADFLTEHTILVSLDDEIELQTEILEALEVAQTQPQSFDANTSESISIVSRNSISNQERIDQIRSRLNDLTLLRPQYNLLNGDIERAQARYDHLSTRLSDTELRESFTSQALFIQVIKQATMPNSPKNEIVQTLILGVIASLGLGIMAAFMLDYALYRW